MSQTEQVTDEQPATGPMGLSWQERQRTEELERELEELKAQGEACAEAITQAEAMLTSFDPEELEKLGLTVPDEISNAGIVLTEALEALRAIEPGIVDRAAQQEKQRIQEALKRPLTRLTIAAAGAASGQAISRATWGEISAEGGAALDTLDPSKEEQRNARWAAFEILEEREAAEAVVRKAVAEFEKRAEGCREVGTNPEPFVYAASYLRAALEKLENGDGVGAGVPDHRHIAEAGRESLPAVRASADSVLDPSLEAEPGPQGWVGQSLRERGAEDTSAPPSGEQGEESVEQQIGDVLAEQANALMHEDHDSSAHWPRATIAVKLPMERNGATPLYCNGQQIGYRSGSHTSADGNEIEIWLALDPAHFSAVPATDPSKEERSGDEAIANGVATVAIGSFEAQISKLKAELAAGLSIDEARTRMLDAIDGARQAHVRPNGIQGDLFTGPNAERLMVDGIQVVALGDFNAALDKAFPASSKEVGGDGE